MKIEIIAGRHQYILILIFGPSEQTERPAGNLYIRSGDVLIAHRRLHRRNKGVLWVLQAVSKQAVIQSIHPFHLDGVWDL